MLIGFSGPIGSGKTYGARLLQKEIERFGWFSNVVSFASIIKIIAERVGNPAYTDDVKYERMFEFLSDFIFHPQLSNAIRGMIEAGNEYPSTKGVKNRRLLQLIGTEYGRDMLGEDVWVDALKAAIARADLGKRNAWIVDDVRFDNEARALDYHIHIKIAHPTLYRLRLQELGNEYVFSDHASERSLTHTPHIILDNDFEVPVIRQIAESLILPYMV